MTTETETARMTDAALAYLREQDAEHLNQLDEFLRIQSVSADPDRAGEVRRTAEWIAAEMTRIGVEHATIHETSHHPIVTGDWLHAGADAPTVLVYCHYDVQPTDPDDEWIRPPFEPRHEDGRIFARGVGDDKGQLFMHLKATEAWIQTAGRLPVNLRFFFEGDEEVGSAPIEAFIDDHADLLNADVCVVSDGDTFDDEGIPAIGYGLRGIAYWEVRVQGPAHDVHSGQYGGGVENPANVLVRMLASLTDAEGRFTVPGFYDRVRDLTDDERAAYAALPFDEVAWRDETGIPAAMDGELGHTLPERLSARPTFDINGITGGYTGEGAKTIIPAWASAKISHAARARPGLPRDRGARQGPPRVARAAIGCRHGPGHPRRRAGDHAAGPSGRRASGASPGGRIRLAPAVPAFGRIGPGRRRAGRAPGPQDADGRLRQPDGQLPRAERVDERAQPA